VGSKETVQRAKSQLSESAQTPAHIRIRGQSQKGKDHKKDSRLCLKKVQREKDEKSCSWGKKGKPIECSAQEKKNLAQGS